MDFDPATGGMKCPYCGQTQAVAAKPDVETTHPLREYIGETEREKLGVLSEHALEVTCTGCGSRVVFEPPEVAGLCAFCGAKIVAQPKAADPMIAPDGILPAAIPKQQATVQVKQWLGSRWLAPGSLQQLARQESIQGVYLPHWMYDAQTVTQYTGQRGEYYYVTERYQARDQKGRPVMATRQVRRTRWYPAAGEVSRFFDDLLIPATRAVNSQRLAALTPWDLDKLHAYEPAYLSGFKAQRYQVPLDEGYTQAQQIMTAQIQSDIRRDIGGDEQQIHSMNPRFFDEAFRHLLLPAWIAAYRFQGKVYQVIVNARTGEVQGERPYSAAKIALLVIAILLFVMLIAITQR
jgi:ribosomal protein S27E